MKISHTLLSLPILSLLVACAAQPVIEGGDRLPWRVPAAELDISALPAPQVLAGRFVLQGEINNPANQTRLLRYHWRENEQRKLDITLYPLPGGWEDLPAERMVAGHYGQIRQHLVERLMQPSGVIAVNITGETIEHDEAFSHPIVSGRLQQVFDRRSSITRVELTALPPMFVRIALSAPEDEDASLGDAVREALLDYLSRVPAAQGIGDA